MQTSLVETWQGVINSLITLQGILYGVLVLIVLLACCFGIDVSLGVLNYRRRQQSDRAGLPTWRACAQEAIDRGEEVEMVGLYSSTV